ncbi:MAG: hypothetical protein RBR16_09280, partial [Syntrophus sp. (in: bacteria)]|nr:hypothetical protein [Syntrophus sp. (in: bacteria)]
ERPPQAARNEIQKRRMKKTPRALLRHISTSKTDFLFDFSFIVYFFYNFLFPDQKLTDCQCMLKLIVTGSHSSRAPAQE